jgi:hypothetical protein
MTNAQNVLINIKNGKSGNYPFDDPNYRPRVVSKAYKTNITDKNGNVRQVERTRTRLTLPLSSPDQATLKDMGGLPYQRFPGFPNPNNTSSRKNPRIVNNSPKFIRRRNKNNPNRVSIVQVRAIPIKRLSKEAVQIVREGDNKAILNKQGKVAKQYIVTRLQTTKRDSGLKFNGFKPKKKK